MLRKLFILFLILLIPALIAAGVFVTWGYYYITRDLPQLSRIEDYRPPVVSKVYADDGTLIAEFAKERRYRTKFSEVPSFVRDCFLAAEDASFYTHPGIDLISIVRAFIKNMRKGAAKQGGSTITQQVVKNLLLTSEKKLTRKLKEAILSYQLEQKLTKDEIFEIYLNQIFFGNTAYGIKAAARVYFHKELQDLTLAEAALLAGLPKAPSRYSPILNPKLSKRRQRYVFKQMVKAGFIPQTTADEAVKERIKVHRASQDNIFHAPYFVSELRRVFEEQWKDLDIDRDGLQIHTTVNLEADRISLRELRAGLRNVDKRRGWRGPVHRMPDLDLENFRARYKSYVTKNIEELVDGEPHLALVTKLSSKTGKVVVNLGYHEAHINLKEATWARKQIDEKERRTFLHPEKILRPQDVIEVSVKTKPEASELEAAAIKEPLEMKLDQTPELEGAVVILDPGSGRVVSVTGGYSYRRSMFNRVTQSLRQPGSAFKPVVYLAAVDGYKYTPATIVHDVPRTFRVDEDFWTPGNFDDKFLGNITLRSALQKSRNLVSADIISRIGVDAAIRYARKLGITSRLGRNLSLSLGSSEVSLLELAKAYGVFANKGVLFDSVFVDSIVDRDGNEIYNYENEILNKAVEVISEESAFVMANMMKGVVQNGTGWRVREIGRPVAGKTGTSNDLMDAWFIGYTPNWVCGVWAGFDLKKSIGDKETGGRVSSPIWLSIMREFLDLQDKLKYEQLAEELKAEAQELGIEYVAPEPLEPLDFSVPDGVDPMWVNKFTGHPATQGATDAILEYFVKGTEPSGKPSEAGATSYLEAPDL